MDLIMPEQSITDEELAELMATWDDPPTETPRSLRHKADLDRQFPRQVNNLPCPRCRKILSLRDGKYGIFYGCPDYPRCKGTVDANQATAEPAHGRQPFHKALLSNMAHQMERGSMDLFDAPPELLRLRREAEDLLEEVWKTGLMSKKAAEKLAAEKLGHPLCFTEMPLRACEVVISFARDKLRPRTRFDFIEDFDE